MFYLGKEGTGKNESERGGKTERTKERKASVVREAGILFVPTSKATRRHPGPFSQGSFEISCMNIKALLSSECRVSYRSWFTIEDAKEVVQVIMNYKKVRTGGVDDVCTAVMLLQSYFISCLENSRCSTCHCVCEGGVATGSSETQCSCKQQTSWELSHPRRGFSSAIPNTREGPHR